MTIAPDVPGPLRPALRNLRERDMRLAAYNVEDLFDRLIAHSLLAGAQAVLLA